VEPSRTREASVGRHDNLAACAAQLRVKEVQTTCMAERRERSRRVQAAKDAIGIGDALDGAFFWILAGGPDQLV